MARIVRIRPVDTNGADQGTHCEFLRTLVEQLANLGPFDYCQHLGSRLLPTEDYVPWDQVNQNIVWRHVLLAHRRH